MSVVPTTRYAYRSYVPGAEQAIVLDTVFDGDDAVHKLYQCLQPLELLGLAHDFYIKIYIFLIEDISITYLLYSLITLSPG
jgi:hypothetical protein